MTMITGGNEIVTNVLFYQNLKIQIRRLIQDLKIYFDEKDITLDVHFSTTDYTNIYLYFFKDKNIKSMEEYIKNALKEKEKHKYEDYNIYDKKNADMQRSIDFESLTMWNGKAITSEINLRLLTLKNIQTSQYYGHIKPNYDKNIDSKLSEISFNKKIEDFVKKDLSYPFGIDFESVEKEKEFVYSKDDKWHYNFLYEKRVELEKYNLTYSLFNNLYKRSKDFNIRSYEVKEENNILFVVFNIKDKKENEYSLTYILEKTEEKQKEEYRGEKISYVLPKYILKDTTKILITKVDDKTYKKLITKFENVFN